VRVGSGFSMPSEPIDVGDSPSEKKALLCDGDVFEERTTDEVSGERGTVVLLYGFVFSAPALNWWRRYERFGWHELDGVRVVGVGRDGPYAQNEFLRQIDSPFSVFSDVDGEIAESFGVLRERDGMQNASTARRSAFVLDDSRTVRYRWVADDDIAPLPREEVEKAVSEL
jgi:hypothetical protein